MRIVCDDPDKDLFRDEWLAKVREYDILIEAAEQDIAEGHEYGWKGASARLGLFQNVRKQFPNLREFLRSARPMRDFIVMEHKVSAKERA